MNDTELIERAAKAAGFELFTVVEFDDGPPTVVLPDGSVWKPLHDDGDALGLAEKLGIKVADRRSIVRAAAEKWPDPG